MTGLKLTVKANRLRRALFLYASNRSLRAWAALVSHLAGRAAGRQLLACLVVGTTFRCQCRCGHCYAQAFEEGAPEEMDTGQIVSLLEQARRLGALEVIFSGGEPLLRRDIVALVARARGLGFLTRIDTNGWLLAPGLVSRLKEAGLTQFGISIDDADPETHDRLRGLPGLFAALVRGTKILREHGIPFQVITYGERGKVTAGLERIIGLGKRLGAYAVFMIVPVASGRWADRLEVALTPEETDRMRSLQDLRLVYMNVPTPDARCPVLARSILYVTPQGEVSPCPMIPYSIGNLRESTLADVWRRHCAGFRLESRGGYCLMNSSGDRETLRKHAESLR